MATGGVASCNRPDSCVPIRGNVQFGHSGVILTWGVADDRWVYERARIDSYVCVSIEKGNARIAEGDRCCVWLGLRDMYGSL